MACLQAAEQIEPYLSDAAHYPGGRAARVFLPTTEAEVARVLDHGETVLAVGAQSSLTGGATPRGGAVLSTARMNRILRWQESSVVVEAGVVLAELEVELAARGLYYPPAPTFDGATVGGMVSTNAAGAATFKYGATRNWVEALSVVLADGDVLDLKRGQVKADSGGCFEIVGSDGRSRTLQLPTYRMPQVPKNSAGYWNEPGMDLIDLFIGSEGTLGVVTTVELRLVVPRPQWFVALVPVDDEGQAIALVEAIRKAVAAGSVDVTAVEYMDHRCLEFLKEDGADTKRGVGLPAKARALLLVQAELCPQASREDAMEQLSREPSLRGETSLGRLCDIFAAHGVFDDVVPALPGETARQRALFGLREDVPESVNRRVREFQRTCGPEISKAAADVIVPFSGFAQALRGYRSILTARQLDHAIWGHISDGNLHPNIIARSTQEMDSAREAILEMGQLAIDLGGSPMSEHGTGRSPIKHELLRRLYGAEGVEAMRGVKRVLDPQGILAPGVMFPAVDTWQ
ncbi:MAG: FAD-binding oxidoreductase [Deltaproteobacteria bacterium]